MKQAILINLGLSEEGAGFTIAGRSLVIPQSSSHLYFTHVNIPGTDFRQRYGVVKVENYPKMEAIPLSTDNCCPNGIAL